MKPLLYETFWGIWYMHLETFVLLFENMYENICEENNI